MRFCFENERRSLHNDTRGRPEVRSSDGGSVDDGSMLSRTDESQSVDNVSIGSRISSSPEGPPSENKPLKRKPLPHYELVDYALVLEQSDGSFEQSTGRKSDTPIARDELVEVSDGQKRKTILNSPVRSSHYSTPNYRLDFISLAFPGNPSVSQDGSETTYLNVKVQQLIREMSGTGREGCRISGSRVSSPRWTHEATNTSSVDATVTRDNKGELTMTLKHGKGSSGTLIAATYPVLAGQRCYVKDGSAFFEDMFKEWRGPDIKYEGSLGYDGSSSPVAQDSRNPGRMDCQRRRERYLVLGHEGRGKCSSSRTGLWYPLEGLRTETNRPSHPRRRMLTRVPFEQVRACGSDIDIYTL
jgi:hypothetical protein